MTTVPPLLKIDFHTHTADDPMDAVPYTPRELIDHAAGLGFDALAITLHETQLERRDLVEYASTRGIILIGGVERSIEGRHVLLLNFPAAGTAIDTFADLRELRKSHPDGLVIAPHPFYPHPTSLRGDLAGHAGLFDAVELSAFYTSFSAAFNHRAARWARTHGKPVVANSDAHRLPMLGTSFSLVAAPPEADAICSAVRAGRVRVHMRPLGTIEAVRYFASLQMRRRRVSRPPLPEPVGLPDPAQGSGR